MDTQRGLEVQHEINRHRVELKVCRKQQAHSKTSSPSSVSPLTYRTIVENAKENATQPNGLIPLARKGVEGTGTTFTVHFPTIPAAPAPSTLEDQLPISVFGQLIYNDPMPMPLTSALIHDSKAKITPWEDQL